MDKIARFYDLDYGDFELDVLFYKNYAELSGSPILELACGTGRLLVPLAHAGFEVTGIDISPAMLEAARGKLRVGLDRRVHLVRADARDLSLDRRFTMAFFALNSFCHLTTLEDQVNALEGAYRHLAPEGRLILDLINPDISYLTGSQRELILNWVKQDPATGNEVVKYSSSFLDPARQLQHVTFVYDETGEDGHVRRTTAGFSLHYFFRYEVELLLERCGFYVEALYGSYDLEDYYSQSEKMIFSARRRP